MDGNMFDYAVIGAGVEGSGTAYYLSKCGKKVVLLEQFRLPHTRGSSHGKSRIIRKAYPEAAYVKMMQEGYQLWEELERNSGQELYKQTGLLYMAETQKLLDEVKHSLESQQLPYKLMTASEIHQSYPNIEIDSSYSGLFDPAAGLLRADRCLQSLQSQFVKYGGIIQDGDGVAEIHPSPNGDFVDIQTEGGKKYRAKGVVICPGSWAKTLLGKLGLNLPLQVKSIRVCYWKVKEPNKFSIKAGFPCMISEFKQQEGLVYGLPTDEYNDLYKFCMHGGTNIDHPDERDKLKSGPDVCVTTTQEFLTKYVRNLELQPAIVETCIYTVTPDENFILDYHPKFKNVVIGAGFSGHGFKFGTVAGKILGDLVQNKPNDYDLSMFSISRFDRTSAK